MTEDDLNNAYGLLNTKGVMENTLEELKHKDTKKTVQVSMKHGCMSFRTSSAIEAVEREISYVNSRLRSLGITEIS